MSISRTSDRNAAPKKETDRKYIVDHVHVETGVVRRKIQGLRGSGGLGF